jgi:dipeptidyl aminopeptidase/acylaminoacyl peptidase
MPPSGDTPGRRSPALLHIHGGPHTPYGSGFFDEFPGDAGAGYAVVYTNPRGRQGSGEACVQAALGDWGGGDFADVMAGLDEALRSGAGIDPEQLGGMGGRDGGALTSGLIGHTQHLKAACAARAVHNLSPLFGPSDIGHPFLAAASGSLPWDHPQWYLDHAPRTSAKNMRTPLLLLHAEADGRQRRGAGAVAGRKPRAVTFGNAPAPVGAVALHARLVCQRPQSG